MQHNLQHTIMRRIYYAYMLRLIVNKKTACLFVLAAMLLTLTQMVSFAAVFRNLMSVRVSEVGTFFYNAFANTEAWTLFIITLCVVFSAILFRELQQGSRTHGLRTSYR